MLVTFYPMCFIHCLAQYCRKKRYIILTLHYFTLTECFFSDQWCIRGYLHSHIFLTSDNLRIILYAKLSAWCPKWVSIACLLLKEWFIDNFISNSVNILSDTIFLMAKSFIHNLSSIYTQGNYMYLQLNKH